MTRPKREDKPKENAQLSISVEEFMRTRDNVVTSLTTLQGAIGDLLRAYINHTTSVLGGGSGTELNAVTANIITTAAGIEEDAAIKGGAKGAKKKTRKKKDPNAPKAPPTAYFLYAQHARPIIKQDLGPDAKGDAVTLEASKRWNALDENEKANWRGLYKDNFAKYKAELATYNAEKAARGEAVAEEEALAEDDMARDPDSGAVAVPVVEEEAQASSSSSSSSDSESEEEEAPPPPKPEPTPKKRGKAAAKQNGVSDTAPQKHTPVPLPSAVEKTKGADKKKRAAPAVVEESIEEPKKKKGRKGRAVETVEETVEAPVTPVEKDKKRKRKGGSGA